MFDITGSILRCANCIRNISSHFKSNCFCTVLYITFLCILFFFTLKSIKIISEHLCIFKIFFEKYLFRKREIEKEVEKRDSCKLEKKNLILPQT